MKLFPSYLVVAANAAVNSRVGPPHHCMLRKWAVEKIGRGWASVLKTHLSSGMTSASEKRRKKYFNVSPRK